ncbi:MAG: WYL domain-containing protein [Phycisphaerae bacterium]|nr:WYL domain-containing protein [Phycisphaerae bacterium]
MSTSRLYRILRRITILQSRSNCSVNDLAAALGVSRRAVLRDLNMLEMAHIPYCYASDTSGYRISRHVFLPPVNLTVTDATFEAPEDVDADAHFGLAWNMIPEGRCCEVPLHFDPIVAGNVAEICWHEPQQVDWNDDGSIEFRVTVDGLGEIGRWVLGYGDKVEVIAAVALRRRGGQTAARAAARHTQEVGS